MQDVVIERMTDTDVTVIAPMPVARGEQMLLHVEQAGSGGSAMLVVQGLERQSLVVDGQIRHRLRLRVVQTRRGESA